MTPGCSREPLDDVRWGTYATVTEQEEEGPKERLSEPLILRHVDSTRFRWVCLLDGRELGETAGNLGSRYAEARSALVSRILVKYKDYRLE